MNRKISFLIASFIEDKNTLATIFKKKRKTNGVTIRASQKRFPSQLRERERERERGRGRGRGEKKARHPLMSISS